MRQLWSVIRFEFLAFAKNKTFIGMTILLMIIALIAPAAPAIFAMFDGFGGESSIAVVDRTGWFDAQTVESFIPTNAVFFNDTDAAIQAVQNGEHDNVLEIADDGFTLHVTAMGLGVTTLQHQATNLLRHRRMVEGFHEIGVDMAQVDGILNYMPNSMVLNIGVGDDLGEDATETFFENFIYAYVMSFVLYMGLILGGAHLLTTVVREKATKTMELLVTSCKPSIMLNGKVIGVGAAILTQILAMIGSVILSMQITPLLTEGMDVFTVNLNPMLLVYLVVFFLLGFVMYAYIYAALASTVSRMEDATSIGQLPQLLLVAGFFATMIGLNNPGAQWVTIVSHIPLLSPFVMFARICMGTAATWEIAVSLVAQVATIGIISWMGAKIYRMGTLMYGAKPTMKNLLEAFK